MPKEKATTKSSTKKKTSEEPITEKIVSKSPAETAEGSAKPDAETAKKSSAKTGTGKKPVAKKEAAATKEAKPTRASAPAKEAKSATTESVAVTITTIIAKVDVGYGNSLFIRGEGNPDLSWNKGIAMQNNGTDEWYWSTISVADKLTFKFLLNDETWAAGDNLIVSRGETLIATPHF